MLHARFIQDTFAEHKEITTLVFKEVREDYFNVVWDQLSNYTTSMNEMLYFYSFLWPHYLKPIYDIERMQDNEASLRHIIANRGNTLYTHPFRQIL